MRAVPYGIVCEHLLVVDVELMAAERALAELKHELVIHVVSGICAAHSDPEAWDVAPVLGIDVEVDRSYVIFVSSDAYYLLSGRYAPVLVRICKMYPVGRVEEGDAVVRLVEPLTV